MCSVGPAGRGGTGSFISADGLIITNHHVALDAVRQASTAESDHSENGFVARSQAEELAGPDYEAWITRSCDDVSDKILEAARAETDPLARAKNIRDRSRELEKQAEEGTALRCQVKEMSADKSYVLFTYERLRDVRIVYVPPMSLGNFGGDTDNFEWPRHSSPPLAISKQSPALCDLRGSLSQTAWISAADFTLLRAYVALDGSAAEPSADNVPYKYLIDPSI